jgi:hypothetical protein
MYECKFKDLPQTRDPEAGESFALIQQLDSTRPWILDGSATKRSKLELKRWEHEND